MAISQLERNAIKSVIDRFIKIIKTNESSVNEAGHQELEKEIQALNTIVKSPLNLIFFKQHIAGPIGDFFKRPIATSTTAPTPDSQALEKCALILSNLINKYPAEGGLNAHKRMQYNIMRQAFNEQQPRTYSTYQIVGAPPEKPIGSVAGGILIAVTGAGLIAVSQLVNENLEPFNDQDLLVIGLLLIALAALLLANTIKNYLHEAAKHKNEVESQAQSTNAESKNETPQNGTVASGSSKYVYAAVGLTVVATALYTNKLFDGLDTGLSSTGTLLIAIMLAAVAIVCLATHLMQKSEGKNHQKLEGENREGVEEMIYNSDSSNKY